MDSKGDDSRVTYQYIQYARYGDLEAIYHFKCDELLADYG